MKTVECLKVEVQQPTGALVYAYANIYTHYASIEAMVKNWQPGATIKSLCPAIVTGGMYSRFQLSAKRYGTQKQLAA